jgi:PAS domain S-box-containing protein
VRAYEQALIRAVDYVRIGLVIVLFVAALVVGDLVTDLRVFSLGLFIGSLLSLWARFEADWELLRGLGRLPAGAGVLAVGDLAWLSLVILGSGALASPFAGLLVIPILYSVALFSRLKMAPIFIAAIALLLYITLSLTAPATGATVAGHLTTVVALAFLSYAVCQILERERSSNEVMMRELSEGIILLDSTGRIVAANRQIERLTAVPIGCMIGEQARDLRHDGRYDVLSEILADVADHRGGQEFAAREITLPGPDVLDVLCTTARLPGLVGERIGYVVICEDVTAIKSALRAREGGEASIDGDLRSPTAVLKVAASMLQLLADGLHEEDRRRVINALDFEPRALVSNVASLMNVSSLEDPGLIPNIGRTDVRDLVRRVRRRLLVRAEKLGIAVREDLPSDLPSAHVDAPRIEDALHRLCDNALRHSPEGGEVRIGVVVEDDTLEISVSDEGPGIAARHHSAIFEKFTQVDHEEVDTTGRGVGLGLYIVSKIAALHGGEATVDSEEGQGATFRICVPLSPDVRSRDDAAESAAGEDLEPAAVTG